MPTAEALLVPENLFESTLHLFYRFFGITMERMLLLSFKVSSVMGISTEDPLNSSWTLSCWARPTK